MKAAEARHWAAKRTAVILLAAVAAARAPAEVAERPGSAAGCSSIKRSYAGKGRALKGHIGGLDEGQVVLDFDAIEGKLIGVKKEQDDRIGKWLGKGTRLSAGLFH